jgi:Tol biopolymer transport system component/DNA-binding winged helix-turn-helix (wHTH) protein
VDADFKIGQWLVQPQLNLIRGPNGDMPVEPKAMEVLVCLAKQTGDVVPKDRLMQTVWAETFVTDEVLTNSIWELRKAFRDDAKNPRVIQTVFKKGYRLIPPVSFDTEKDTGIREESVRETSAAVPHPVVGKRSNRWVWPAGFVGAALLISAVVWLQFSRTGSEPPLSPITVTPLTSFPGLELQPTFSPDGNQVAFVWNGEEEDNYDIYLKVIDAPTPLRLTHNPAEDLSPAWSPDGRHVAFVRYSETKTEVLLVPVIGGPERLLHRSDLSSGFLGKRFNSALAWSPDGNSLAFSERISTQGAHSIVLISMDDLGTRRLTSPPPGSIVGDWNPVVSPDGRTVAFIRWTGGLHGDVYLIPLVGGETKRLTFDNSLFHGFAWTPDSSQLIFSSGRSGSQSLGRVSVSGGTPERLTAIQMSAGALAISRLGYRLAFVQEHVDFDVWRYEVVQPSGKLKLPTKLLYSTRSESGPQFSPDGNKVVFASVQSGTSEIWVCDSNGSNPLQLTSLRTATGTPRWSPDGSHIAFDSRKEGYADIFVISAQGGKLRRLTSFDSDEVRPSWSRNGQWIYFGSNRSGDWQVWKMQAVAGEAVQVTKHGGREAFESFDARYVYYSKGWGIPGIWRVPVEGGEEIRVLDQARQGSWGLTPLGIYFVNLKEGAQTFELLSFKTNRTMTLGTAKGEPMIEGPSFAVSSDGRWILLTQVARQESDLMLVENFR